MDDSSSDDEPLSMRLAKKDGNGTANAHGGNTEVKKDPVVDEPVSPVPLKPQPKQQPSKKKDAGAVTGKAARDSTGGGSAKPKGKQEGGSAKPSVKKEVPKVKKEIPKVKKEVPKVKKEATVKEEAKGAAVKRVKKVFENPGQTRDTPDELDPLRKFYSSLRLQRPESMMAAKWLCMHGLLPADEAEDYLATTKGGLRSPEKGRAKSTAPKTQKSVQKSSKKAASAPPKKKVERLSEAKKRSLVKRKRESSEEEVGESESEDEESESEAEVAPKKKRTKVVSESESEEEVMPKSKRPLARSGSKPTVPTAERKKKGSFTVFEDDALESDSDDDKPLAARKA